MLNGIITWSLRHRFVVLAAFGAFIVLGVLSLSYLNFDAFPDTTPVQVQINTVAPALGPEEVERQLTFPVEQALGGLPGLVEVRSISKFGLSQVVVTFQDGTDIYFARQQVTERLGAMEGVEGAARPKLGPVATGLGEVLHYVVTSKGNGKDLTELRTLHDWVIRPGLRTVPGTAEINSWGGNEKQYQVRLRPERLAKHGLHWDDVTRAVGENNKNAGGGNISRAGEMFLVQGVGRASKVEDLQGIVLATNKDGAPVKLKDVADVTTGHEIRRGAVTADGRGEVVLGLGFMLIGENSHDVTTRLKGRLAEVRKTLPPDVKVEKVYDRTELVDHVIDTVRKNLFEGGLLVIAVLFIFLGNLRAGLLVALAIPLSMLFAFFGMLRFGIAASLLSLGALDFGLVVDSSVVLVENVVRHLAHPTSGKSRIDIVRDAALEVRKPTLFGELIILVVYLPILTLEGVEGKLFRPMALTVIFALAGSLLMSLTLTPVLASLLLSRRPEEREPWVVRLARWLYAPVLRLALRYRLAVVGLALACLAVGVVAARGLGSEFVPRLSEGALTLEIVRLAGTDLDESIRANTRMEKVILEKFPDEVAHVWSRIGTAEVATDPMGVEASDMFITLKPRDQWQRATTQAELVELLEKELRDMPGQQVAYTQPIEQRVNEMTSGVKSDVAVKVFGDDFDQLLAAAGRIEEVLKGVDGCEDLRVEQVTGQPVLRVKVKQDQLQRYDVPAKAVLDVVEAVGSKPLGEVVEGQFKFPLVVRLPEKARAGPEAIRAIPVLTQKGERLPLSRLADVDVIEGPATISREWGQRRVTVQCNVRGRDVGGFVAEARRKVEQRVTLPSSRYRVAWGGQFEHLERARLRLLIVVPLALALIFGLLYFTYHRWSDVLLIFTGVPFASVGGVVALWLRDIPFSISAAVGFIALSGVSVLNSMLLVTFTRQLLDRGVPPDAAVEQAALTRLRPVLMTALVASLGFLPMALSTGTGAEVQRPLATVVIGGVVSSTLLTLVVLPVLFRGAVASGPPLNEPSRPVAAVD